MGEKEYLIVVKYGSRVLTGEPANLPELRNNLTVFSKELANYADRLVIVSSGAVFCGRMLANRRGGIIENEGVLATLGNPYLFSEWQQAFGANEILASQNLVTHRELSISEERERLRSVLHKSLNSGVVPIINENDALSDKELKKLAYGGDNDGLAAEIANLLGASHLILYTDTDGFMVNGRLKRNLSLGELGRLESHAGKSDRGGGMATKLGAARAFVSDTIGVRAHIARAGEPLERVLNSEVGTTLRAA